MKHLMFYLFQVLQAHMHILFEFYSLILDSKTFYIACMKQHKEKIFAIYVAVITGYLGEIF